MSGRITQIVIISTRVLWLRRRQYFTVNTEMDSVIINLFNRLHLDILDDLS